MSTRFPSLKINRGLVAGGGGAFDPVSQFGANLDFLMVGQDAYVMKGADQSVADVRGVRDQAVDTYTSRHISDFSAGVDGWAASRGTITGNIDEIPGFLGENDCASFAQGTALGAHFISQAISGIAVGDVFRMKLRYYIPSANTALDGISFGSFVVYPSTMSPIGATLNAWTETDWHYDTLTDSSGIYITFMDGTTTSYTGTTGDLAYVKDIIIESHDGESWVQTVTANMPHNTETSGTVDSDGVQSHLLAQNGGSTWGSNNIGTFYFKFRDQEGSGVGNEFFVYDGGGTWFKLWLNVLDKLYVHSDGSGGAEVAWFNANPVANRSSADLVLVIKSDGTDITAFQGTTSLGVASGTETHWINSATSGDRAALGANLDAATYFANDYRCAALVNRVTTTQEDEDMVNWIDAL